MVFTTMAIDTFASVHPLNSDSNESRVLPPIKRKLSKQLLAVQGPTAFDKRLQRNQQAAVY
jgi:hypothetical protein